MEHKELHDRLLANLPEGATHEAESCPFCALSEAVAASDATDTPKGGDMSDTTTYTQEDLDSAIEQAVAEATKPLSEELADIQAAASEEQIETRIAEVRAEASATEETLTAQVEEATAKAAEAQEAHDSLVALLEATKAEEDAQAELTRVKTERLDKIQEVATFEDEYVEANADRWAQMDEDAFSAMLEALGSVKSETSTEGESESDDSLKATAMTASSDSKKTASGSAISEVLDLAVGGTSLSNL